MQIVIIIFMFFFGIYLIFKFPKIVTAIFKGIFSFIVYFVKNAPDAINRVNNQKRKD